MKVGNDGILLGAWSNTPTAGRALDVGTGTGLLALMCAQRSTDLRISAIEMDESSAIQAAENFAKSPWSERLQAHHTSFQTFNSPILYDFIICNPPYYGENVRTVDEKRDGARWNGNLPYPILLEKCRNQLKENGRLSLVIPFESKIRVIKIASRNGLYPTRAARVQYRTDSTPSCYLIEFGTSAIRPEMENIVQFVGQNKRSRRFNEMIKPFLLQ